MSSIRDRVALLEASVQSTDNIAHPSQNQSDHSQDAEERRPALPARPKSTNSNPYTLQSRTLEERPVLSPRKSAQESLPQRKVNDEHPSPQIRLIDLEHGSEPDRLLPNRDLDVAKPKPPPVPPKNRQNQFSTNLDRAKRDIEGFSRRTITNAGKTFDTAGNISKQVLTDSTTALGKIVPDCLGQALVPTTLVETKDDLTDLVGRQFGKPGICSGCITLPWKQIFTLDTTIEDEYLHWDTTLARILLHRDWCMGCKLFLSMLRRKEFDPLRHPEVAPYIEHEKLRGITMDQFVADGWADEDEYWPFGRSQDRYEGASHYLGPLTDTTGRLAPSMAKFAGSVVVSSLIQRKFTIPSSRQTRSTSPSYSDGYRQAQKDQRKHPIGCVLSLSIATSRSKTPGLIFADLMGFGNRPGGSEQTLSAFTLQAVNDGFTVSCKPGVPLYYGLKMDQEWINVSIGRLWIAECELRHGSQCDHGWSVAEKKPTFLRLIDLESLTLVEVADPRKSRYVCLSYVWGTVTAVKLLGSNLKELTTSGGLRKYMQKLPRTIIDAMEVTKALGENYLWIDSLCIMQENVPESLEQIEQMDRVYGSALLTIVAAEGQDANAGFKGVRRQYYTQEGVATSLKRRLEAPSADWSSEVCVNAPFPTRQNVAVSKWETRAWTFQERLLSRRLLIFAGDEMIWHCRGAIWREDTSIAQSAYPTKPLQWLSLKPQYLGIGTDEFWQDGSIERTRHSFTYLVRSGTFAEYANLIEQYSRRKLTYDNDALNAVAGLMQIFMLCFQSEILEGLPAVLLDMALLWRPLEVLRRRMTTDLYIPSWTWAAWTGRVKYDKPVTIPRDDTTQTMEIEDLRPLLRYFMLNSTTGRLEPINGTARGIPLSDEQLPAEWEVHAPRSGCRDALHDCHTPTLADIHPVTVSHLTSKHLVFSASASVRLKIGGKAGEQNRSNTPHEILDENGDVVGSITVDAGSSGIDTHAQSKFIVMAEAHTSGLQVELTTGLFQYYAVMLIRRESSTGISSRLGIGRALKVVWVASNPSPELICLG